MLALQRLSQSLTHLIYKPIHQRDLAPRLEAYLAGRASQSLGFPPDNPGVIETIDTGRNTVVRRWTAPGGDVFFARAWRYDRLLRPAREHSEASRALAGAGLRVPELLLVDDSPDLLREGRFELAIERAAQGRPLHELLEEIPDGRQRELLERLAGETALMHRASSPVWGKPWRPLNPMIRYRAYLLGRIETLRTRILKMPTRFEPVQINRALDMLAGQIRRLPLHRAALVHGDLFSAHVFADEEGRLTWIDFGTVHYGHPAEDLCILRNWLPEAMPFVAFLSQYQAAGGCADPDLAEAIEQFDLLHLWEKLGSRLGKRNRAHIYSPEKNATILKEQAFIERQLTRRMQE